MLFVEAEDDVDPRAGRHRGREAPLDRVEERLRGECHLAHAAFEEVAREDRLGEDDDLRARLERRRLRDERADAVEVPFEVSLSRPELRDGEREHGRKVRGREPKGYGRNASAGRPEGTRV